MKRIVFVIDGCGGEEVLGAVERLFGERSLYLEGLGEWVDAVVEGWGRRGNCRGLRVRFRGLRVWSEVFEVCVSRRGGLLSVEVVRRGGVGRVSAGLVGGWLMEELEEVCPELVHVA